MGNACCVAAPDKMVLSAAETERRHSPPWSFRWDNHNHNHNHNRGGGRVAGEDSSLSRLDSLQTQSLLKSPPSDLSFPVNNHSMDTVLEQKENDSTAPTQPSPDAQLSSPPSSFPASRLPSQSYLHPASSSTLQLTQRPRLLKQLSDGQNYGINSLSRSSPTEERQGASFRYDSSRSGPSEGWSRQAFSEIMSSSRCNQPLSNDNDCFGLERDKIAELGNRMSNHQQQTCAACARPLSEKSLWSRQNIFMTNELSVSAVLACGHVYHGDCLEQMTPEVDKFDPSCPICTLGEKKTAMLSEKALNVEMNLKAKRLRNRVLDGDFAKVVCAHQTISLHHRPSLKSSSDPPPAMAEASGKTLMDLISADPTPVPAKSSSSSASASASSTPSPAAASAGSHVNQPMSTKTTLGEKKSKRATLMQIQNDTISVAKAALNPVKANIMMPQRQRQKKKPVSYTQLARSIHELAATLDQKSSQKQLVNHVFPKLAVYNSVDPSLAPSLLMLNQQCEDRNVLRYVYYYLARILSDTGMSPGGGIPTPNWDALADIDAGGGVTRADVVPRIVNQLTSEASNSETEFHARRLQALKALTYSPSGNSELLSKLYEIVFGLLDKVADVPNKRKKGVFGTKGGDKESIIRSNLQYAAMSALRRLPLDPGNPLFLHRAAQGVSFADPVAVRHSLEILSELAARDPYSVAMTLEKLASPAGALQDILHLNDVLARVALARLCHSISRARALDERPDIRSHFNSILYQLLLDPSERVCYEAILCILGKYDNTERTDERASGWYRLTREILKLPEAPSKDKSNKTKRPQPLIKLVLRRLESSFRSFSRPVLHAAARVVQEMGKSRAAAFAMGLQDIDESVHVNAFSDVLDDAETNDSSHPEGIRRTSSISAGPGRNETIASLLASLMEVVRTTVACECVYVRGMVVKALIWMQSPHESLDELKSIIASELSDPAWPAALVNDVLLTLHARFKATPDMAVILLEIARIFATKVPGKIDADVLQLLWKTCLIGAGPDGKHTALEAVTIVLDLPPPQPGSMSGLTSLDRVSASDPKSALALQKLVQAAVWFLGENANYAASEYAWESATPPGTALMMLDADKMVAAASSRNPTLAGALTRLQRCAFSGSWEVRIVAVQALTTIAIRSGEPFRLQIYEFLYTLAEGGVQSQLSEMHLSNGEDQGVSGTGLGVLITPMLKVLDEMYVGQDELIKDIRNHDNANKEWKDEELKKLYETHERLLDFVSLFCYIPRAKYLPLGPISAKLIDTYRTKHNITASSGSTDPTVLATGISDLIYESTQPAPAASNSSGLDDDLVNAWAANLGDDGLLGNNAPAMSRVNEFIAGVGTDAPDVDEENVFSRPSVGYDDMWAKTLLENNELEEDDARSGSSSPDSTGSVESSISSHFGGMNYPSLFSSKPSSQATAKSSGSKYQSTYEGYGSPIREEPPPPYSYSESQSRESFENPMAGSSSRSYGSDDDEPRKSTVTRFGTALYDFTAGGDDELNLTAEEELEIEYEVDGWFYVKKKRPGRDGKMAGLVPVLYVNQS